MGEEIPLNQVERLQQRCDKINGFNATDKEKYKRAIFVHAFEADFNRKKTSIFSDKLHKKVCNEHINVVDDGTIHYNRGSVNIDDEGNEGQKTYLVRNGILESYMHEFRGTEIIAISVSGTSFTER